MTASKATYDDFVLAMTRLNSERDRIIVDAFIDLERHHTSLAGALMLTMSNRRRAERWMFSPQRAFDGRTAYDVLAGNEDDLIWDELDRMSASSLPRSSDVY